MATLIFGLGYIGSALAAELRREGRTVVGMDNAFATDWPVLERLADGSGGSFRLLRGDIRRASDVDAAFRAARTTGEDVAAVYLLAAQASAHADAAPAEYTEETNLRGPRLVYEGAFRHGSPPVVYGSSFHIYGPQPQGEIDEARPYGLLRDLAHLSKVYAEKLGEMYAVTRGLTVAPVRLGIVYGLGPVMKRDLRFVTVPHAFCLRVLAGEPLPIHPGGLAPLPFIHLDDAVSALRRAGAAAALQCYAPANAVGEVASVLDVARFVQRAAWDAGHDAVLRFHTPEGVRT
ncbi:MAG: NAD(P)-dependent oxidoreductase, partial [Chloroflexota bacterium]|nr:NAD(P)-dependent oxidoreductase [Chloroflexota bacterium]